MDIRPFYSGSKIISGSGALDALSFELASVNAEKPLLIASDIERTAEKTVAKALKATAAVIGGICRLQSGEKNSAKTIAETFNRFGCDSLLAIGDADLINAVKAARVELSFGKAPAEIDFTQPAPPRRSVPFVSVAVLTPEIGPLPNELILDSGACITSPLFYPDTVFIDPRVTGKSAAVSKRSEIAAAAFIFAIFALSDTQAHPAVRAYAHSALQQVCEAIETRSRSGQTRLIANARFLSQIALTGVRFVPEIALLPFLTDGRNPTETLKTLFEAALPTLSFAKDDLSQIVIKLVPNNNAGSGKQTLRSEFETALLRLTQRLMPNSAAPKPSRSELFKAFEAVKESALTAEQKNECLKILQIQMECTE